MRRPSPRLRWPIVAVSVALVGLALPTMNAVAAEARVVVAGTTPIPANVTVVNKAITTTFDVTLAPRSAKGLGDYITSLSDTASPIETVRTYFEGYGLSAGALSKGRLVLHVKGTTTQIALAFAAHVETVRRSDGAFAAQLTTKGSVPAPVAHDIAGVAGLSSVVQPSTNLV